MNNALHLHEALILFRPQFLTSDMVEGALNKAPLHKILDRQKQVTPSTNLECYIPFNCCKCTVLNHQTSKFSSLLGTSTDWNDITQPFLYTSTSEFPTLLCIWCLTKVPLLGGDSLCRHYREDPANFKTETQCKWNDNKMSQRWI